MTRTRQRRGEQVMVPRAEFESYYGRPIIHAPSWAARDIAGYFFLGGLAGAGSVLAAGAHLTGRPRTATAMKVSSLAAVSLSAAALIHDLGKPGRFANMLRVFKPTSPMSMGSWVLSAYGPAAGAAALSAVTGRLPRAGPPQLRGPRCSGRCWPHTPPSLPPTLPFPPGTALTENFPTCSRRLRRPPPRGWH